MTIHKAHTKAIAEFPTPLQALIKAELAAGNSIVEISTRFPAPPVGACLKLAKRVTTLPRESGKDIRFYEHNGADYSGEFSDAKGFFFVLEPPLPPEPATDMDAIRAEHEARQRAADAALLAKTKRKSRQLRRQAKRHPSTQNAVHPPTPPSKSSPLVERFRASMVMNHERWHDGTGYDLELLPSATPEEREQIEQLLLSGGVKDWRDIEALATFNSPRAQDALRTAFARGGTPLKIALLSHAPKLFSERECTATIVSALQNAEVYGGLTQTLLLVEDQHPQPVIDALLRGVLDRDGTIAGEFAAMLLYLHGKATSAYDMEQRPFFLKFQDGDRQVLFRELCERIGINEATQRRLLHIPHARHTKK